MDVNQEKVLMRVDFNVDLSRIIAHLPSIQKYLGWEPEKLILLAHLSPDSGPISLNPIAQYLAERLGLKQPVLIKFKDETIRNGFHLGQKLFLLENVRFHREEEENNLKFAQRLAAMGDIFILDALSVAHRNHASVSGIARVKRLKAFAGPLLIEEVTVLSEVLTNPQRSKVFFLLLILFAWEDKSAKALTFKINIKIIARSS
jgi:3-phosphoglycerate kinase